VIAFAQPRDDFLLAQNKAWLPAEKGWHFHKRRLVAGELRPIQLTGDLLCRYVFRQKNA
jgi:hypothetical protein